MPEETLVQEVEAKAEEVKQEVVAEAVKIENAVATEVKKVDERVRVDITDSEKLFVTKVENDYLKAQVEIQQLSARITHLQGICTKAQESFTSKVTELAKKYEVDLKDFIYHSVEQAFVKQTQQQGVAQQQGK